jgi:hypothetical protein
MSPQDREEERGISNDYVYLPIHMLFILLK